MVEAVFVTLMCVESAEAIPSIDHTFSIIVISKVPQHPIKELTLVL
jgi:hypothetical protein